MVDLFITAVLLYCTHCKQKVGYEKVQNLILSLGNFTVKKVNYFPVPSRDVTKQTLSGHGEFGK
jgi:hypothetical protein